MAKQCYICGRQATTKEHFPPKCFFPKRANLNLSTVPSCTEHNNDKSKHDQYFFAQILINTARENNLPKKKFIESIVPQLRKSPGFKNLISHGSVSLGDGTRAYPVDDARMKKVMDGICHAIYFTRFEKLLDRKKFQVRHEFLNFTSEDVTRESVVMPFMGIVSDFLDQFSSMVEYHEADKVDEVVYSYRMAAPGGSDASITLHHNFYGSFDVFSMLTRKISSSVFGDIIT